MVELEEKQKLIEFSTNIRKHALAAIHNAESGHPGGALSAADVIAYLFEKELPLANAQWPSEERHRFILSKGHACPVLYAAAEKKGWLEEGESLSLRKLNSSLQGHPSVEHTPWVEANTGSLGQGFSVAIGMALGLKYRPSDSRVYVMLGDGELQEGQVWEATMSAAHFGLDNLCAIVDYNKLQSDDSNANIMGLEPLLDKWQAFNWHVLEINGHDFDAISRAFNQARDYKGKPTVIIAHTIKGQGVEFMESSPLWHGSVKLSDQDLQLALSDLDS